MTPSILRAALLLSLLVVARLNAQATSPTKPAADKPIYRMTEAEVHAFLKQVHATEPDLHKRIVAIARRNLGQPYEMYLLGEMPFEKVDTQPVYCLHHSDCVVFAEHTLAMALTDNFPDFLAMLQRIRFKEGKISVLTRNHYTEADWNINNRWLATDITRTLAASSTATFNEKIDRKKFFASRYKLETDFEIQQWTDEYIPHERMGAVKPQLRDGDIVNFVRGVGSNAYVGHVGLIGLDPNGEPNLIHSAEPEVREEPIDAYIARATRNAATQEAAGKAVFKGFKFLRVVDDPMKNLRQIDGPGAPNVWVPRGSPITFEQYVKLFNLGDGQ